VSTYYKRLSRAFTKNILVPDTYDIDLFIREQPDADYYDSIYLYEQKHKDQFDQTKSLSGIIDVKTNRIIFDLDSKNDLEKARVEASELCSKLLADGIEETAIRAFFSGGKGFHVELFTDEMYTRKEIENILSHYAGGLSTVDFKITDEQRVIRTAFTKHPKTGLYKIPLTLFELTSSSVEAIQKDAKELKPKFYNLFNSYEVLTPPATFSFIKHLNEVDKPKHEQIEILSDRPDFTRKPKHLTPVKFALQEGFFESGERNHAYMILASTYRGLGYNEEIAYNMLKATNRLQSRRTGQEPFSTDELWKNIIKVVFSPNWRGGTYSESEDKLLDKIKTRFHLSDQYEHDSNPVVFHQLGGDSFARYARSFYETRIYTGLKELDNKFPICAGSNIAIVGAASSGKTALTLNILEQMRETGAISLFASLDMAKSRLYEKLLYKVTGGQLSRDQLYQAYLNGEGKKYDNLVKERFPNVYIFAQSSPTVGNIREHIKKIQDTTGKPVRLLMIDYFERVTGTKSDDTAASKEVASGIQDLIADFPELTPITLFQPNKMALGGGPDKPIMNYASIKGSSFIFQSARQILSIWRPFFSPEYKDYDKFMEMAILKNDLGELEKFVFNFEGKTGLISELNRDDLQLYKEYMKEKVKTEQLKDDNGFGL